MLVQNRINTLGRRLRLGDADQSKRFQPLLTVIAGLLLVFLVTLTSVGASVVGAVMLAYLYPLRLTPPPIGGFGYCACHAVGFVCGVRTYAGK